MNSREVLMHQCKIHEFAVPARPDKPLIYIYSPVGNHLLSFAEDAVGKPIVNSDES